MKVYWIGLGFYSCILLYDIDWGFIKEYNINMN